MHCGYRERLTGELRNVDMRSSGYDDSITWNQLSGTDQQQVANSYVACFNIVHGPAGDAMSHARSGVLEGSDCVGCSALSIPLQRFASGLHQHDDEAGKRLPQNQREQYRKRCDEVDCEAARRYFRSEERRVGKEG